MDKKPLHILVVDDDQKIRQLLADFCKEYGFTCNLAASGDEAWRLVQQAQGQYDAALVDHILPGEINGLDLIKKLKSQFPDITLIFFMGQSGEVPIEALKTAHLYLAKPFDHKLAELAFIIEQAVQNRQAEFELERLHDLYGDGILIASEPINDSLKATLEKLLVFSKSTWISTVWYDERGKPYNYIKEGNIWRYNVNVIRKNGLSHQIMQTGETMRFKDVNNDPQARNRISPITVANNIAAMLGLPLIVDEQRIGVIWFHYDEPQEFSESYVSTLQPHINRVAGAYQSYRLEYLQKQNNLFKMLRLATEAIMSKRTLEETLVEICNQTFRMVSHSEATDDFYSCIAICPEDILEAVVSYPAIIVNDIRRAKKHSINLKQEDGLGIAGRVANTGEYINLPDAAQHPDYIPFPPGFHSHLSVPLKIGRHVIGVLTLEAKPKGAFTDEMVEDIRFVAGLASSAIDKARLLDRAEAEADAREMYIEDVTHQLVGPLGGIRAWCEYLVNVRMASEARDSILKRIFDQSGNVQRYALNFFYAGQNEQSFLESFASNLEYVGRGQLVQLLIDTFEGFQGEAKLREIRGPSIIRTDFERFPTLKLNMHLLEILFLNLYDNAVKYSYDNQEITVRGRALSETVEIEITDYGIPLEEGDLKRMFQRGMRSEKAMEYAPRGTGIGLFMSKRIARLHGGDIRAIPSPTQKRKQGNEVKFIVSLPIPNLQSRK